MGDREPGTAAKGAKGLKKKKAWVIEMSGLYREESLGIEGQVWQLYPVTGWD